MEWTLDRVLAGLESTDPLGLIDVADAAHRTEDVEHLTDVELDPQLVPDRPSGRVRVRKEPVRVHEGQITDEDGDTFAEST